MGVREGFQPLAHFCFYSHTGEITWPAKNKANRQNSQKSTGPRSAEGKARASRNALKHGLTSRRWVLADEDHGAYLGFLLDVQAELGAEGRLETTLAHQRALWRLGHVPAIETELFERLRRNSLGADEGLGAAWARDGHLDGRALARLARYEGAIERGLARTLAELRRVQAARRRDARENPLPAPGTRDWYEHGASRWPGAPVRPAGGAQAAPGGVVAGPQAPAPLAR